MATTLMQPVNRKTSVERLPDIFPNKAMETRFDYLKRNLHHMAELVLEHLLLLCDALEKDDYAIARHIIQKDDLLDDLEKENDNISQSAILDAITARGRMGLNAFGRECLLKHDPLRFGLSAIRLTIYLEQIGDNFVNIAEAFVGKNLMPGLFSENALLNRSLSRMATAVGMSVESLVEEKDRFYGSIREVTDELSESCHQVIVETLQNKLCSLQQTDNLSIIIHNIDRIGGLSLNIAEELVRLGTGEDVRHMKD